MSSPLLHRLQSPDGFPLSLAEFDGGRRATIFLQHGLAAGHEAFDLAPQGPSLARWLAARGFRVFASNLRGRAEPRPASWSFSDYLLKDVPALSAFVRERAGRFHWVGHSLGGILGLSHAALDAGENLLSVTTVGSALHYGVGSSGFRALLKFETILRRFRILPGRAVGRLWGPFSAFWLFPNNFNYNRSNMDLRAVLAYHARVNCDLSVEELVEMSSTFSGEGILCGALNRRLPELAGRLPVPWLSVCGTADPQCPPDTAAWTFERLSAPRKERVIAGREHGFSADYGHYDLIGGRASEREIWPLLERFIAGV
jgi:pimeloyl-ACP methyl ester carboxylesterase